MNARRYVMSCFVGLVAGLLPACDGPARRATPQPPADSRPAKLHSNVLRSDYAGSGACAQCHADIFARWARSPMHNMTRLPERAQIATPFQGSVFRFKEDRVLLSEQGGARFLRIESRRFGDRLFRITKVIGGHHREDFAGIEVSQPDASAAVIGDRRQERVMPISYVLASHSFRYKGYSVMSPERPGLRPGGVWNRTCIFCHNTVPLLSTVLGALSGPGTPPYQGEVVDPLLPPERRQELVITDERALRAAVVAELSFLRGGMSSAISKIGDEPVAEVLRQGVRYTRGLFNQTHLVEVGIGCESCHGGAKEHVADSRRRPSFVPRSELFSVKPEPQNFAQQINRVCARCHQVLFSHYPHTWEGGNRQREPGGSNINSGEARDMLMGGCASQMSCVTCHDPHAPEQENQRRMAELEAGAGNAICLRCHEKYREPTALRSHTHHDVAGAGSLCMNCHMPKKNMSLDTRLARYHRIGSPTDRARVEGDRPLECALCHADRSIESLVADMERMYAKTYNRQALQQLYGDLSQNAMMATLQRGKPHEQVVAIATLGNQKRRDAVPLLAQQLVHPLPILRYYAQHALEQIVGSAAPFDLHQETAKVESEARQWLIQSGVMSTAQTPPTMAPAASPAPSSPGASDED